MVHRLIYAYLQVTGLSENRFPVTEPATPEPQMEAQMRLRRDKQVLFATQQSREQYENIEVDLSHVVPEPVLVAQPALAPQPALLPRTALVPQQALVPVSYISDVIFP